MKRIINFYLVVAFLFVAIPLMANEQMEMASSHAENLSSGLGRFVFGQISQDPQDQYMLDTVTGRLWRKVQADDGSLILKSIPYKTLDGGTSVVPGVSVRELKTPPLRK